MSTAELKSYLFRRERESQWRELEQLVGLAERHGVRSLDVEDVARLPILYRAALSSLSVARTITLDRNVIAFLESLTARAYFVVYGTKRDLRGPIADFFVRRFPETVRRFRWHLLLAAGFLVSGIVTGAVLVTRDQDLFYSFVSEEYAAGRDPSTPSEHLRRSLYEDAGRSSGELGNFATFLFTHNARIGMLCFALGFAAGVPVFWLVFTNGLLLGAFGALYDSHGLGFDFWCWVLPHGITELLAVVLCAGAGLALGQSLVFPGRRRRLDNLAQQGRDAGILVIGAVCLFCVAGGIEGFFRQWVQSIPVRLAAIVITTTLWTLYFSRLPRTTAAAHGVARVTGKSDEPRSSRSPLLVGGLR